MPIFCSLQILFLKYVYVSDLNFGFETYFVLYCVVSSIMLFAISRCVSFVFTFLMQLDDREMCTRYVINQWRQADPGVPVLLCVPAFVAFVYVHRVPHPDAISSSEPLYKGKVRKNNSINNKQLNFTSAEYLLYTETRL